MFPAALVLHIDRRRSRQDLAAHKPKRHGFDAGIAIFLGCRTQPGVARFPQVSQQHPSGHDESRGASSWSVTPTIRARLW